MSATALYWFQLQHAIHLRIDELAEIFKKGITANAAVVVPASGSEPPELSTVFRLTQEEAAENWLSAMGAGCIVQLLAEAQSIWQHPKLWRLLYAISKEKIAARLEELLHDSFHITQKDLGLIEKWKKRDIGAGADFDLERSEDGIGHAVYIACAKKSAVKQILDQLLGVSRELAFGEPSKPKFSLPAAQVKTTPEPKAQPGPPVPSVGKPTAEAEPTRGPNASEQRAAVLPVGKPGRKRSSREKRPPNPQKVKRGSQAAEYNEELKHIVDAAQAKQRYDYKTARKDFPRLALWKALDDIRLSRKERQEMFRDVYHSFGKQSGRFELIGKLMRRSSGTAVYDDYKAHLRAQKRKAK
jgi:hypothetical protein